MGMDSNDKAGMRGNDAHASGTDKDGTMDRTRTVSHEGLGASRTTPQHAAKGSRSHARRETAPDLMSRLGALERDNAALTAELEALRERTVDLESVTAMAAHELLKPLVLSEATLTDVLQRSTRLDIATQDDLQRLIRSSARVRLLVEVLLTDMQESGGSPRRQDVDMAEVVTDCLELLRSEIDARRPHIAVDAMPVVFGDRRLLFGAMGNLLANALKYGPRDGGEIHITAARAGSAWRFEVESAGRPIPQRDGQRIFEPWARGRGVRRVPGVGLGLALVRRIVERHGGEVGVTALKGKGNAFYFTLPA
jgi:signal transduction histidine kinase